MNEIEEVYVFEFLSRGVDDTARLAEALTKVLEPNSLIGLTGELGAGKTEFVRWFVKALGIKDMVSSPSFVLENIYGPTSNALITNLTKSALPRIQHWDLYRISDTIESDDLLHELGENCCFSLIEWPEKIPALLSNLNVLLTFKTVSEPACSQPSAELGDFSEEFLADSSIRVIELRANSSVLINKISKILTSDQTKCLHQA